MNSNTFAAGVVGFLLGGLTVSIAAELENDDDPKPAHGSSNHQSTERSDATMARPADNRPAGIRPD